MSSLEMPYAAIIPFKILADKQLHATAKIFYGCLVGLAKNEGYCYASDDQLAEMFGVTDRQINRWLGLLEKKNYISRHTVNLPHRNDDGVTFWRKTRKIYVGDGFSKNVCDSDINVAIDSDTNVAFYEPDTNVADKYKSLSKKEKKKEEPIHCNFSEQEYESLVKQHGKAKTDEIIQSMNDYCDNHRPNGYKNWMGAFRTFERQSRTREKRFFPVQSKSNQRFVCEADAKYVFPSDEELIRQGRLIQ